MPFLWLSLGCWLTSLTCEATAQFKRWLSILNLSLLLQIEGLPVMLGACFGPAHAMWYRTTSCSIRLQWALLLIGYKRLAYALTASVGSARNSHMGFFAELSHKSVSAYMYWRSLVNSSKFSRLGSVASHRSLAHSAWWVLSVCRWVRSGWMFQVSRKETAYLTWSERPLGNTFLQEAKFNVLFRGTYPAALHRRGM